MQSHNILGYQREWTNFLTSSIAREINKTFNCKNNNNSSHKQRHNLLQHNNRRDLDTVRNLGDPVHSCSLQNKHKQNKLTTSKSTILILRIVKTFKFRYNLPLVQNPIMANSKKIIIALAVLGCMASISAERKYLLYTAVSSDFSTLKTWYWHQQSLLQIGDLL